MKKALAFFLTLILLPALTACGSSSVPADPNCGVYEGDSLDAYGVTMDSHEVFGDDFSLELQGGGKAVLHYDGKTQKMSWKLDGTAFHAEGGGQEINGTLSEGKLTVENLLNSGMNVTFINRAYGNPLLPSVDSASSQSTAEEQSYSWWEGKWYGWGVIYLGSGIFEEDVDTAWDVVADISVNGDHGTLIIRDIEDQANAEMTASVRFEAGATEAGRMVCESGNWGEISFEPRQWLSDPGKVPEGKLAHTFLLNFRYTSPDNEEDRFELYYVLRPWGMDWEDVRRADTSDMIYADMMPMQYEDWYLPQIGQASAVSGNGSSQLLGSWAHSSGYVYTFREDGTGTYAKGDNEMTFTYTVSGDQLSLFYTGTTSPMVTTFRVENGVLIILDSFGSEVSYTKTE